MNRSMIMGAILVACGGGTALPAQVVASAEVSKATLAFDGKATLGDFTGTTTTVTGHLEGATSLAAVRGWVEAPSKSLSTDNGHRDRDMGSSLEIDKYPIIRFDLDSVVPGAAPGDSMAVTLIGRFTLHGETRPASIPGYVWITPHSTRFRGAVPVDLKDYKIGGLSKMLGMFKMNEHIVVRVDVVFGTRETREERREKPTWVNE